MKTTNENGVTLIIVIVSVLVVLLGITILFMPKTSTEKSYSDEDVLREVSNLATSIQKARVGLKEALGKNVTTQDTIKYLKKIELIDENNNISSSKIAGLKLSTNGNIFLENAKKGQVLLTDYYDKKQVKTIWTQNSNVDNNLVTIQINDGKFLNVEEDTNNKVWKYKFTAYDESTHGRFSYWENEYGDIISTEETLYESASLDRIYTAVYNSEKDIEPGNRITMAFEKVNNSIVGSVEGMHYAKDIVKKVYSKETGKYEDFQIVGSTLEQIGILFTIDKDIAKSEAFSCTTNNENVGYTKIFDRESEILNKLVSYNYEETGTIMISQAINITLDAISALSPKKGDTVYMKPYMLFYVGDTGYYIDGECTYELIY